MQILKLNENLSVNVNSDAEIILWNHVFNLRPFTRITPICHQGNILPEFVINNINKEYLALEIEFSTTTFMAFNFPDGMPLYDYLFNPLGWISNNTTYYDGANIMYGQNYIQVKNIGFNCMDLPGLYDRMKFIGYRLNY